MEERSEKRESKWVSGGDGSTGGKGKRTGRREIGGEGTGKDVEERSLERGERREWLGWIWDETARKWEWRQQVFDRD